MKPSLPKRLMRSIWRRLPRRRWSYKLAKVLTRSVLRPQATAHEMQIEVGGRFRMHIDLSDIVGNDLYCMDDHYEAATLKLWYALAPQAQTILDLGSQIGLFACAAAAVNSRARIVAVEAYEPNVTLLRQNAAPFPNLEVVPITIGVATASGKRFRVSPITGGGYLEDDGSTPPAPGRPSDHDIILVNTVALADFCAQQSLPRIDLMKMDLEGLEQFLLLDQEEFWRRWDPQHVIVELTTKKTSGKQADDVLVAMDQRGYDFRRLEGLYTIPWMQDEDLANWHFWKRH